MTATFASPDDITPKIKGPLTPREVFPANILSPEPIEDASGSSKVSNKVSSKMSSKMSSKRLSTMPALLSGYDCLSISMPVCICIHTHTNRMCTTDICANMYTCMYAYVYMCIYVFICVCMYIYIYIAQ